ncbi:hypothetical protein [Chitinibacter sp. GC72]|uniref:hypothetical protein n=1 Tax=Chitinibacter sp. GC72 TaxID=1526917 RepID=UPI0012F9671C|nr:hypothetical protein [Chitinibacter sp. GC72]
MLYIFDMSAGDCESNYDNNQSAPTVLQTAAKADLAQHHEYQYACQLRLLTVAEAEESRPAPRPRPWLS